MKKEVQVAPDADELLLQNLSVVLDGVRSQVGSFPVTGPSFVDRAFALLERNVSFTFLRGDRVTVPEIYGKDGG
jgi:hypothetical protein